MIAHSVATFAHSLKDFPEREEEFKVDKYEETSKYHGHKLAM